jgi:hypothetical protein
MSKALEACRKLVEWADASGEPVCGEALELARAALAEGAPAVETNLRVGGQCSCATSLERALRNDPPVGG